MALVLGAGGSRRFGRPDKLLAPLGRRPLFAHALAAAMRAVPVGRVMLVVPSAGGRLARRARHEGGGRLRIVVAREHRRGLGASLAAGLRAVRPIERELLIFLADMPDARVPRGLRLRPGVDAARPAWRGRPGHPLLVRSAAARRAQPGTGDRGLLAAFPPDRVLAVPAGRGSGLDIDTPTALRRARRMGRWGRR